MTKFEHEGDGLWRCLVPGAILATRLRRAGWRWLRRPWNLFDATVILLALLPVVGDGITILRTGRGPRSMESWSTSLMK